MQKLQAAIRSGQRVIVRDEPWLVVQTEGFQSVTLLTLRGAGTENAGETARVLSPFDAVHAGRTRERLRRGTRREALAAAAAAIGGSAPWSETWTAAGARIDLRPWQLEPAVAAVDGASRILLADAVGLGKTIQALLIVSELAARGLARRVLVLTPASLRAQWADEATSRFGLKPAVLDHETLADVAMSLPAGVNPWSTSSLIVSSIDLVKRGDVRGALDAVPFDVLIVDEAHHLTPATDRGAVVADLAARTPWLILVTATPHTGDEASFRFLTSLGNVNGDGGLRTFRRQAHDVELAGTERRERVLVVSPTARERALLDGTVAYAEAVSAASSEQRAAALVAAVIARRAASCADAARRTLERRLAFLSGTPQEDAPPLLPWDEGDDDGDVDDAAVAAPGLADRREELAWLNRLVRLARDASGLSSKVGLLRRLLRRTTEPVIVFSEYRDVVRSVASRIADLSTVAVLHGGLSAAERRMQLDQFGAGRARTLVATDAAGEGLNLQARCRLVVNLELPWSPLRLEQRIGRVHRIGQTRRVHALQLAYADSFESVVRGRFEERLARASAVSRGRDPVSTATATTQSRRLGGLQWQALGSRTSDAVCADRGANQRSCAVLVFGTHFTDGRQHVVERHVAVLRIDLDFAAIGSGLTSVSIARGLRGDLRVREVLRQHVTGSLERARLSTGGAADAIERRAASLIRAIQGTRAGELIQTSLFDRRLEQQARLRSASIDSWTRNLERQREAAGALRSLAAADSRLVAAWFE